MKKVLTALCLALACSSVMAQEAAPAPAAAPASASAAKASWPVWLAFNSVEDIDVIGLRLTLPYGKCEGVTGFDLGIYGSARYFEGLQANILRNEAKDVMSGAQVGVYNTAGCAASWGGVGAQVGLFNEARSLNGFQIGIINIADKISGFQIGLINRAESAYGFQFGGVNIIRDSDLVVFPIVNIGFDLFPNY